MKLSALEKQALRAAAARRRVDALQLGRKQNEGDFLIPMRSGGCGTEEAFQRHRHTGDTCQACLDAHSRWNNPQAPSEPDFAEECWGPLE